MSITCEKSVVGVELRWIILRWTFANGDGICNLLYLYASIIIDSVLEVLLMLIRGAGFFWGRVRCLLIFSHHFTTPPTALALFYTLPITWSIRARYVRVCWERHWYEQISYYIFPIRSCLFARFIFKISSSYLLHGLFIILGIILSHPRLQEIYMRTKECVKYLSLSLLKLSSK